MGREREDGHVYFTGGLVAFPGAFLRHCLNDFEH